MDIDTLRSPLYGEAKDLKILEDIGTGRLGLPKKEETQKLVSNTALTKLQKIADEYHIQGSLQDRTYVLVKAGIDQIRSQLFGECIYGSETKDPFKELFSAHLKDAKSFLSSLNSSDLTAKRKKAISKAVNALLKEAAKENSIQPPNLLLVSKKLKALADSIATYKTEVKGAASSQELKEIARGKAKIVLADPNMPGIVYYQPTSAQKKPEIEFEVKTAKDIRTNLYTRNLQEVLGKAYSLSDKSLSKSDSIQIASLLVREYPTISELVEAIKAPPSQALSVHTFLEKNVKDINKRVYIEGLLLKNEQFFKNQISDEGKLALDLEVVRLKGMEGTYTVKTGRANGGDLEARIQKPNINFGVLSNLGLQFLQGMRSLHRAGFVQGDMKPENVLIYENADKTLSVKISDWGKATPTQNVKDELYTGNPRFAPPELRLSQAGEVYSSGLMLIRILEESVLKLKGNNMLAKVEEESPQKASGKRRGVEKYLCMNARCPQTELPSDSKIASFNFYSQSFLSSSNVPSSKALKLAETEIHKYIRALINSLNEEKMLPPGKLNSLQDLLREMTLSDPKGRPSMDEVTNRYEAIMG